MVGDVEDGPLVSMPFRQFIYSLGSRSSAPGGGSASAAIAAMVRLANSDWSIKCIIKLIPVWSWENRA